MRSIVFETFGHPADTLKVAEIPTPQPGPGEVRIRTLLAPIHNHDLLTVSGDYGYKPVLPATGGSEAVGVVDALGLGVTGLAAGQRVAAAGVPGAWAEYFTMPAAALVPLPDAISDEAAAQLLAMPLSALMLIESLPVSAGDWIVQNAANGAVGKAVARLATARGIRVLSLVRRDAGVAELAALGIGDVLSTEQPEWLDAARELLASTLARAAIDSIGGAASGELASLLGERGELISFGSLTGQPLQVPAAELIHKQLSVRGFWGSKVFSELPPEDLVRMIGELQQRVASGALALPIDSVFGFDDVRKAVEASQRPGRRGKVLLRP